MKVKDLVQELKNVGQERLTIVAEDDAGRKFPLGWGYSNDGPDWDEFAFYIHSKGWQVLDTDMAKRILDHAYTEPGRNMTLFSDETDFTDFSLRVTWPCDGDFTTGGAWQSVLVKSITIRENPWGNEMVFHVGGDLPPWHGKENSPAETGSAGQTPAKDKEGEA